MQSLEQLELSEQHSGCEHQIFHKLSLLVKALGWLRNNPSISFIGIYRRNENISLCKDLCADIQSNTKMETTQMSITFGQAKQVG